MIDFTTFLLTSFVLTITPGNDTIFILSRSIAFGRKAGIISTFGVVTGVIVHTMLAAFGLSLIIASSAILFNIFKFGGVCYLVYIGWSLIKSPSPEFGLVSEDSSAISFQRMYWDAAITNILNPKVALFFIALLPQFVDPSYKNTLLPFFYLGFMHAINATTWFIFLASFSGYMSSRLKQNAKISTYIKKICGGVLIGLGVKLAFEGRG